VAFAVAGLADVAAATTVSEWYGLPLVVALVAIVALSGWGYWAASGGRSLVPREAPATLARA